MAGHYAHSPMAKRKNSSRHGHSGDPRKRAADEQARAQAEATPELEDEVGAALEAGHPIDIVMLASSLIAGLDPDVRSPDDEATDRLPQPEEFVRMFLDSSDPRLHVLAWTVARLLPDARLHHEVDAAVTPGTVPAWLLPLADAEVVARVADDRPAARLDRHRRLAARGGVRPHGDRPGGLQLRRRIEGRLRRPGTADCGPGGVECER